MAQKTDAELTAEANIIKDETTPRANSAQRVGEMIVDVIDSKLNKDDFSGGFLSFVGSIFQLDATYQTINEVKNDLGAYTITRDAVGQYRLTFSASPVQFLETNTYCSISKVNQSNTNEVYIAQIQLIRVSNTEFYFASFNGTDTVDVGFSGASFEIRVY